jgi:hypothetical protein
MFEFDGMIVIVTVVVILVIIGFSQGRRSLSRMQGRVCPGCGMTHPPFAQFCRRCGQRL